MGKENKSYRIRTNVGQDSVVNFSVDNTTETLEILSLKISQENTYRLMGSDTGVVAGRVLANGGFGVPNVKVSVFIEYEDTDNIEQRVLYTYGSTTARNENGVRYNLLPDKVDDECHQNIGTFPSKRVLLDNNNWIDIFDKYYKFTTRTNEAGDYMIYGVPTGNQTIHMDVDMSDIGVLSQKPRDMIYNGYNGNMFESPTKFKVDTNIDALAQVRTQDQAVYVYPFWGDTTDSNLNASITRCDMNINYKFEPTCIFMGSVITDTGENAMTKKCIGAAKQGKMADMITGEGKIEMIRKTPNGQIEQFSVNGDNNINGDGVWCYQIPMNLDYVMHDEFGKMVMTDNPNIGIPTRARVRFRLSMAESPSDAIARKRARFLIPNNPRLVEEDYPDYCETKEIDYEFGTKTRNENFRDLFWNNVYTVKSYIPRLQKSRLPNTLRHLGIKTVNHSGGHNPMPFNNLRIKFNFVYMFLCALVKVLVTFVGAINAVLTFISWIIWKIGAFFIDAAKFINIKILGGHPLNGVAKVFASYNGHGVRDGEISSYDYLVKVWKDVQNGSSVCGGIATWFIKIFLGIGCGIELNGLCETDEGEPINVSPGTNDDVKKLLKKYGIMACNDRVDTLYNCIENQLAQDNEVTQFNFYNDWINGVVYLPLWYRKIKPKRKHLFGLITTNAVDEWCSTDNTINITRKHKKTLRLYNTNIQKRTVTSGSAKTMGTINPLVNNEDTVTAYANNETGIEEIGFSQKNDENCYGYQCHKFARTYFRVYKGLVYEKETMLGDKVYYYKPCDYDPATGNSDLVTLYATDLVLLGSLNDCDIHGIPQFFKTLESTTYNMPPDLMSEYYDYTNENSQSGNDEQDSQEIDLGSRITEYTGADWGNLGADQSNYNDSTITILGNTYYVDANENQYDNGGLFYGLTCFDSYTKPKSCINLSRICELGISLDETNELPTTEGSGTDSDTDILTPDGFISYDEIYNPDYRSMFATLNGNFLKTTLNSETGLLEYDFNYLYIDNFDGSLKQLMKAKTVNGRTEKSDFEEKANYINNHNLEISSDAYLSFRYGNYVKKNGNKLYFYENNNAVGHAGFANILGPTINGKNRQPRYENSFYFYFGLNEGKTAIDKFNTEFFSDCTNKFASDVPYDLTYQGNSWCPINSKDGFIAFNMNVEPPYTVTFTNKDTNDVYFQDNISSEKFIFCDPTIPGNPPDGYSKYALYTLDQKAADGIDNSTNEVYIIPNGSYTIEVTDGYDNTYNDNLTFELPRIGFVCDVNPFNCKNAELMERFKDEGEILAKTYADIADYARFINNNMVIDMNALTYSLFDVDYIIKKDDVYYIKTPNGVFRPTIASTDITVQTGDEYYYYHEPKLDRNIRGFVALSEMTEDNFRIDFTPIDTDFFGSNYIGTSVSVHVTYDPYVGGTTIPFNETYFLLTNGKYEPMVAQEDIVVPNDNLDTKLYTKPIVSVTENHSDGLYNKFNVGQRIYSGETYYIRTGSGTSADPYVYDRTIAPNDITVGINDEFYYKIDICGYLGYIIYDGAITHYIGVPYGGQKYKITVTQLCECDHDLDPSTPKVWCDTDNVTIINIIVYEDEFKMFINGIDYDLIQKFKTGWTDAKLINGEFRDSDGNYSEFVIPSTGSAVYGWDDILNIGHYTYNGTNWNLSQIGYMRDGSDQHSTLPEVMAICEVLHTNYTGNATGADSGETPYDWNGIYCYNAPSDDQNYYCKGTVDKITYSYSITNDLYNSDGNKVIPLTSDGVYYKDASHTNIATKNTTNADYYVNDVYTYTIKPGVKLYDSNGDRVTADQIQHGITYYLNPPNYTVATLGVDYFEDVTYTYEIADGVTLYDYSGNEVTALDIQHGVTYYKDTSHTIQAVLNTDYFETPEYTYRIADGVTLYDSDGFEVTANEIEHGYTYYLNPPGQLEATVNIDYFETHTYAYKVVNNLYDENGELINVIIHGNTYYIDETHTVEAESGVDYTEVATEEKVNVTRYDYKIPYLNYADNEYLYDGNTYRYEYPFPGDQYKYGTVNGYPSGIRVNLFRRTLRIKINPSTLQPYELYKDEGGTYVPVSSMELTYGVIYYTFNGSTYQEAPRYPDYSTGIYTLTPPIMSYELETPLYRAEFWDDLTNEVLVNEDTYGVLTYRAENNIEYNNLECLDFYDYRDIIDKINTTITERKEIVRKVAGTFRINEGETMMTLTTKTKAKPVKYLIAGSSEIAVLEKMYSYKPGGKKLDTMIMPVGFASMSDINNTKYISGSSVKNVSDGYVVDKNLETPSLAFTLPTLTYDYNFIQYGNSDLISNGNTYYSEEIIACKQGDVIKPYAEYYFYNTSTSGSEYYQHIINGSTEITVSIADVGKYFYITGEKLKHTAYIPYATSWRPGFMPVTTASKTVSDFVRYAHTTEHIYKIDTAQGKKYLPYYINKHKHPYYVSVANDNDSVIPPGKDLSNFTDFGENKNLATTFGVHFYNKPLKSNFPMVFTFLNNVPAYPEHTLGDDSYIGSAYSLNKYKYYSYKYPDYVLYKANEVIPAGTTFYQKTGDGTIASNYTFTPCTSSVDITVGVGNNINYKEYSKYSVIPAGTIIYATIDNNEPSSDKVDGGVVLLNQYYRHEVKHNPRKETPTTDDYYVRYKEGVTILKGQTYYIKFNGTIPLYVAQTADTSKVVQATDWFYYKGETIQEIKENILLENHRVAIGSLGRGFNQYNVGDVIPAGDWYYTDEVIDGNHVAVKHMVTQDTTVQSGDVFYYINIPSMKLYKYDFVNSNNDLNYYVYNGDIIYYTEDWSEGNAPVKAFEMYFGGDIINVGETYIKYDPLSIHNQWTVETNANHTIIVPGVIDATYYRYSPLLHKRHVVSLNSGENKALLKDYITRSNIFDLTSRTTLGYVFYDNKTSVGSIGDMAQTGVEVQAATFDIGKFGSSNKFILIDRECIEYDETSSQYINDVRGMYGYSVGSDCLKNDEDTKMGWCVKKDGNKYVYNNYGAYRYYDFGNYTYTVNLTKRSTECSNEPVYQDNGNGTYTRATKDYIPYEPGFVIPINTWYYKKTGPDPGVYSIEQATINTQVPNPNNTYYKAGYDLIAPQTILRGGTTYYNRATVAGTYPSEYTKETVPYTILSNVLTVPDSNVDTDTPQYYNGVPMGTFAPGGSHDNPGEYPLTGYRGVYGCSNGLFDFVPFYGEVTSTREITDYWQPVNVFMPGFLMGYFYNGIPRSGDNTANSPEPYDNSNIKVELNENEISLYTPTVDNPDIYENINVRRLVYTPNDTYSTDYPATYGVCKIETNDNPNDPVNSLNYQYAEVPLVDDEIIYTDGYGDDYRKMILGTLSLQYDMPVFTYFNLGRTRDYASRNLDFEDYIVNKTFFTSDDGYVQHQTLYYVYDLDSTPYPLLYYSTNGASVTLDSNLKYDKEKDRFYFTDMPDILKNINNSNYISKSKSTDFNVWAYLRNKYGQEDVYEDGQWKTNNLPLELKRPNDKFFVIACVDGYYTISPVIETQPFRVIVNYNGFNNKNGSPVYITARDSRNRSSESTMKYGVHYIEDMYYMLYYRFVIHVAAFDYDLDNEGNANGKYNSDVYTQICSVSEGTAEHCYIRVDDKDGTPTETYWASAIKVNLSSLGADAMDESGQIHSWLQIVIEDITTGMRVSWRQTSGSDPNKGVDVYEFENYDAMIADSEANSMDIGRI